MSDKTIIYDNVKNFLNKINEKSYETDYGGYFVRKGIESVRQYEKYVNNNMCFEKSKDIDLLVKRLYTATTGKRFIRKTLIAEDNRELLTNLVNSAILLLLMSNFRIRFANVFTNYAATPYVPNLTRGVGELLKQWQEISFPQYAIIRSTSNMLHFNDKTPYSIIVRDKFMREDYGLLKLLLAAQFSEINWTNDKEIAIVRTIFNNITLQDGTVDVETLIKILKYFTRHNNIITQNIDDINIINNERKFIINFANNINILVEQLKIMPESMLDSVVIANSSKSWGNK